jgi:RNA polymerase sigma-70 factor (ECF subfamily)
MKRPESKWIERDADLLRLFESALAGDESAYREFLESTAVLLRAFLTKWIRSSARSKEAVEDLVQEVLLTIHRKRDLYKSGMPVVPWVLTIAKHRLIDSIRAEARRPELSELKVGFERELTESTGAREPEIDVDELMQGLNERQKQILHLAKIEEVPHSEIAKRLGISVSLVKVTIHRSLQAIRKRLNGKLSTKK